MEPTNNQSSWTRYLPQRCYSSMGAMYSQIEALRKATWLQRNLVDWTKNTQLCATNENAAFNKNARLLANIIKEGLMSTEHIAAFTYLAQINPQSQVGFAEDSETKQALKQRNFNTLSELYENCDASKVFEIVTLMKDFFPFNSTLDNLPAEFKTNLLQAYIQHIKVKTENGAVERERSLLIETSKRFEIIDLINKRFGVEAKEEGLSIGELLVSQIKTELLEPVFLFARDYDEKKPSGAKIFCRNGGGWCDLIETTKEVNPHHLESLQTILSILKNDRKEVRNFLYIPEFSNCHESYQFDEKETKVILILAKNIIPPNSEFCYQIQKSDFLLQNWMNQAFLLKNKLEEIKPQYEIALEEKNIYDLIEAPTIDIQKLLEKLCEYKFVSSQDKIEITFQASLINHEKDVLSKLKEKFKDSPELEQIIQFYSANIYKLVSSLTQSLPLQGKSSLDCIDTYQELSNQLKEAENRIEEIKQAQEKALTQIGIRFKAEDPSESLAVGRQEFLKVQGYNKDGTIEDGSEAALWEAKKYDAMAVAIEAKLKSRPDVLAMLLMVSPEDDVTFPKPDKDWGTGLDGKGQDGLASAYIRIRNKLLKMDIPEMEAWLRSATRAITIA